MANICTNKLTVLGTKEMIDTFEQSAKTDNSPLSLDVHVPIQKECENDSFGWWKRENWGTKRDIHECTVRRLSNNRLEYTFSSAWNPPHVWLETISKIYSDCSFILDYEEDEFVGCGRLVYQEGVLDMANTFDVDHLSRLARKIESEYLQVAENYTEEQSHA